MIIDLILDRKDGEKYNSKNFYIDVMNYGEIGYKIASALDNGEEKDIKECLIDYIIKNGYAKNIVKYVNSVNWLD